MIPMWMRASTVMWHEPPVDRRHLHLFFLPAESHLNRSNLP